jgi:uncharacterized protein
MSQLTPISAQERIKAIDIIRGFAILGIFLVNMPDFNSPIMYLKPGSWWNHPLDRFTEAFIDIFAQASFYTLFSFLFGFGAMIFRERLLSKGYSFGRLFSRRLFVLLIIGCIHAFFIWHGDILISYALTGAFMLLFHNVRPRYLLIWAFILLLIPNGLLSLLLLFAVLIGEEDTANFYDEKLANEALEHYRDGTFIDIFWQRWHDWVYVNNVEGTIFIIISLLPMFLLGAYAAKKKWFSDIHANEKTLKKVWFFSFLIGFIFKLLPYWTKKNIFTEYLQDMFGGPATAIFYAVTIALLSQKQWWNKILSPLAAVGRMSLTNYLFQSVFCTLLFYNYGLGLYGSVRPFYGLLLTLAIYGIQVVLSKLWLKQYTMGPMEWIWRTLTYGQKQPLKRTVKQE